MKIGQEVVCIRQHSRGILRIGEKYVVRGTMYAPCCGRMNIDVGIVGESQYMICRPCGTTYHGGSTWWLSIKLFAPIEEISQTMYEDIFKPQEISQ